MTDRVTHLDLLREAYEIALEKNPPKPFESRRKTNRARLAELIGTSPETLRFWEAKGKVPAVWYWAIHAVTDGQVSRDRWVMATPEKPKANAA